MNSNVQILQTDASNDGINATLLQEISNEFHVIVYANGFLFGAAINYSRLLIWGTKEMHTYVKEYHFVVEADFIV